MDTDKNTIELNSSVTSVSSVANSLPVPDAPISVRLGTREDIGFIDALQKRYSKALGFFPRAQLEGYIDNGWVLVAEERKSDEATERRSDEGEEKAEVSASSPSVASSLRRSVASPLGYVIARDRYLKRDELGVIYQLCVSPSAQRGLIGATLLKELFARSAYGCKLYCCWCAQDLAANKFWEAMGFQAIAFRGGSAKKSRVHIFWQKRIRANDTSTPWWFPAKTEGGAMREDRLVLPIPLGLAWDDAMPVMRSSFPLPLGEGQGEGLATATRSRKSRATRSASGPHPNPRQLAVLPGGEGTRRRAMQFGPPRMTPVEVSVEVVAPVVAIVPAKPAAPAGEPVREKVKCDPRLIDAARELRDRWLEEANESPMELVAGKYDVSRAIEARGTRRKGVRSAARKTAKFAGPPEAPMRRLAA